MSKSPSFQFYSSDWLSSRAVRLMDAEQRGWYIQLLAESWESEPQGTLPDDDDLMRVLAGVNTCSTSVEQRWNFVKEQFKKRGKVLYNDRLMIEVVRQEENRRKKSQAGKASAETRKAIKNQHLAKATQRNRRSTGVEIVLEQNVNRTSTESNLPISSSISLSPSVKEQEIRPAKKQRDARTDHPAIQAFREVKGKYPHKDVWDLVIKVLGEHPDEGRMKECWVAWRSKNFAPENLGWLVDWYVEGMPDKNTNGGYAKNGRTKPSLADRAREHNEYFRVEQADGSGKNTLQ